MRPPSPDVEMDEHEDAPLLAAAERADSPLPYATSRPKPARWQAQSPRAIVLIVCVIKFFITASGMIMLMPVYRLIEDALCHVHYDDDSADLIEEMKCKVDEVQSRLAFLIGWLGLINSIMTLLVAFPYGMLADKVGRKPTAIMAYSGLAVSFCFSPFLLGTMQYELRRNPKLLMFGSLFQLFGGGVQVLFATLYSIAADVSDEKNKASNFLYLTFGATAGGLVGPLLAGLLMETFGPWVPIYVIICTTPVVFALFVFIPETLTVNAKAQKLDNRPPLDKMRTQVTQGLKELVQSLGMLRNRNIPLILVTFAIQNARFAAATAILAQYISKNFGWKLAETSLLLSPLGILNLVILVLLPKLSQMLMTRFGLSTFAKDLFLTRVSTCILVVAAIIEGFSHNIVFFLFGLFISTFGSADSPLARATISHYVAPEYTSRLYGLIGMVEVVGSIIGGPVLAWFFDKGLQKKGIWIGLPWFYLSFLLCLAWVALAFVRAPRKDMREGATFPNEQDINGAAENPLRPE